MSRGFYRRRFWVCEDDGLIEVEGPGWGCPRRVIKTFQQGLIFVGEGTVAIENVGIAIVNKKGIKRDEFARGRKIQIDTVMINGLIPLQSKRIQGRPGVQTGAGVDEGRSLPLDPGDMEQPPIIEGWDVFKPLVQGHFQGLADLPGLSPRETPVTDFLVTKLNDTVQKVQQADLFGRLDAGEGRDELDGSSTGFVSISGAHVGGQKGGVLGVERSGDGFEQIEPMA